MILFEFDSLTPSQRIALSWLIDHGGAATVEDMWRGADDEAFLRGTQVTRATVKALVRRGHLEERHEPDVWQVQVSDWCVDEATVFAGTNPPVLPILLARAEPLAHREHAERNHDGE